MDNYYYLGGNVTYIKSIGCSSIQHNLTTDQGMQVPYDRCIHVHIYVDDRKLKGCAGFLQYKKAKDSNLAKWRAFPEFDHLYPILNVSAHWLAEAVRAMFDS